MSDTKQQLLDNVLAIATDLAGDGEFGDAGEWLDDQLSIEEWIFYGDGRYKGATVLCCCGGPHIEVDTCREVVVGRWGSDTIERGYTDALGLASYVEDLVPLTPH